MKLSRLEARIIRNWKPPQSTMHRIGLGFLAVVALFLLSLAIYRGWQVYSDARTCNESVFSLLDDDKTVDLTFSKDVLRVRVRALVYTFLAAGEFMAAMMLIFSICFLAGTSRSGRLINKLSTRLKELGENFEVEKR